LPLQANKQYEIRLALRVDQPITARICISAQGTAQIYFETLCDIAPDDWCEYTFNFGGLEDPSESRLEITTEQAGNLYIGAVSLLPANTFFGMRPDVIALLKEIGCSILRWPGGNFAGDYRWQDGLLPVDRRAPLSSNMQMETLPHTRGFDCHEIGIDEFIALCDEIGAEPYLTINPAWEGPEIAAAWVEYCNGSTDSKWGRLRADRGHPLPYHVKYWSLGNELGYGHMEGPNTADAYAKHLRPHAEAMRLIDPSIELVSSGIWSDDSWFTDCLANLGDVLNHISHHFYSGYSVRLREFAGPTADEDFRALVTKPSQHILDGLIQLRAKIDAHVPVGRKIGISFDEWNVWYAWYRIPDVVEGIHNASMLNVLCREANRLDISIGCFFEPVNEGAILVDPDKAYLSAGGKVFPLFKAHTGNTLLDLGQQDGLADVDVTASLDEKAGKLVVTLVNRSPQEEHIIALTSEEGLFEEPEGILLSSPDYLPASDFSQTTLSISTSKKGLEFVLPKHSVARVIARV
jgi:alpha-L-arabinofuranosidase